MRDSQGRERVEIGYEDYGLFKAASVNLIDPVEGIIVTLLPVIHVAIVNRELPASADGAPTVAFAGNRTVEVLPKKSIAGLVAEGRLTTL